MSPSRSRRLTIDGVDDLAFVEVDVPKFCRSASARHPVRRPRKSSWITSGRLASLRLPLIAISATPRSTRSASVGPLPHHLLPAARAAGAGRDDAARPVRPARAAAGAGAPAGSFQHLAREGRRVAGAAARLGGLEHPLHQRLQRARTDSAGRDGEIVRQLRRRRAEPAPRAPAPATALADLAVGRRAAPPPARPRAASAAAAPTPVSSASGTARGEDRSGGPTRAAG